ncbi:MAG: protein kinase [Acidobacteria bacterium]|nr:protein kinase [Acidobacteriota bacterium]
MPSTPSDRPALGHFRLLDQLGAGGMGVVYRAHDERLNRDVALKVLPPGSLDDQDTRKRFKYEAQALARLNHPNIATVFEFDSDGTTDFIVMELLSGQTLASRLLAGRLSLDIVIKLGIQIAEGLAAAHDHGILHRDLKPGNLGLTADGQRVKILDFGIAKLMNPNPSDVTQSMTDIGIARGTLAYMAPEQLRGENLDGRADIYAAGSVLYEMATGKRSHAQAQTALLINAVLNETPTPPSRLNQEIGPELEAIILKALEKDPERRYSSARQLAADLERLRTSTIPVALHEAARRHSRRSLRPPMVAIGILALAVVAWQAWRRLRPHPIFTPRPILLVGEFENRTGEPMFDNTVREMLTSSLEQSHLVQVFPAVRVADVLQRMGRAPTQVIDENTAREISQREGLQAFLTGAIVRLARTYVLLARVESASGSNIMTAQASAASPDDIPAQVDNIAESVRRKLGESLQGLKEHSVPLEKVTSRSLDAVRYFTLGKQSLYSGDPSAAMLMFKKAIELDPRFAVAHEYLGITYHYLNQYDNSVEEIREAAQLAERVSEPERLRIMAAYSSTLLDLQKECENYQLLAQLQPLNPAPYVNLGVCNKDLYDYTLAVAFTEKALQLVPQSDVRINLASQLLGEGDTDSALKLAEGLAKEFANNLWAEAVLGRAYIAAGRFEDARQAFKSMMRIGPDAETAAQLSLADLAMSGGQYQDAAKQLKAAVESAERNHNAVAAAKARIALAETLFAGRHRPQAIRQVLAKLVPPPHAPALSVLLARMNAWNGHPQPAQKTVHDIETLITQHDVPALESLRYLLLAEISLAARSFPAAVEAAQNALTYQRSLVAVETLARCYAAAGQNSQAAQQYETLLNRENELMDDTRVEGFDEPAFRHGVEAHYRLAVLYQKMGDGAKARSHIQKFLAYWAHADADLAMYRDAQRRLRTLATGGVPTPAT